MTLIKKNIFFCKTILVSFRFLIAILSEVETVSLVSLVSSVLSTACKGLVLDMLTNWNVCPELHFSVEFPSPSSLKTLVL